jgi:hypothetical protein
MAHSGDSNKGTSAGHTFMDLAAPNGTALPDPGARPDNDPTWPRRYQQYLESVTKVQKFS